MRLLTGYQNELTPKICNVRFQLDLFVFENRGISCSVHIDSQLTVSRFGYTRIWVQSRKTNRTSLSSRFRIHGNVLWLERCENWWRNVHTCSKRHILFKRQRDMNITGRIIGYKTFYRCDISFKSHRQNERAYVKNVVKPFEAWRSHGFVTLFCRIITNENTEINDKKTCMYCYELSLLTRTLEKLNKVIPRNIFASCSHFDSAWQFVNVRDM